MNRNFISLCVTTVRDSPKKMDRLYEQNAVEWQTQMQIKFVEEKEEILKPKKKRKWKWKLKESK